MVVTQQELARRLGVSQALVSRALSGRAGLIGAAPDTVARIRALAAQLGYRPSAAALALRGRSARVLGLVVKDFDDPFFGRMIGEFQSLAHGEQYALLLTGADPRTGQTPDVAPLLKYHLDALIICGSDFVPQGLTPLLKAGRVVVRVGSGPARAEILQVAADEERGMEKLVEYLCGLAHRRCAYLGTGSGVARRRLDSLRRAVRRAGLELRADAEISVRAPTVADVSEPLRRLMLGPCPPTVIVAAEDVLAQCALRALAVDGWQVPRDVSLVGIDDIPTAALMVPALTTVRLPIRDMVRLAFEWAVSGAARPRATPCLVAPELVIRESCAPPPRMSDTSGRRPKGRQGRKEG